MTTRTQEDPTRPRPKDGQGFELDEWDLPLCGPARAELLGGATDPVDDATGWTRTNAAPLSNRSLPPEDDDGDGDDDEGEG